MSVKLDIRLRAGVEADKKIIRDTWIKSYRASQPEGVAEDLYHNGMLARIDRLLERSRVRVACDPVIPARIFGYVVYEPAVAGESLLTIHYCYTKYEFRRCGVASALFAAAGGERARTTLCSHVTARFEPLARKADLVHDESRLK